MERHHGELSRGSVRVVYSGAVVSNGGDAAIMVAQNQLVAAAVGDQHVVLHDNSPAVARRIFPEAEVLHPTYRVVHRPRGAALHRRVLRRLNLARVQAVASTWNATGGRSAAVLTPMERRQVRSLAAANLVAYTGGTSLIERYSVHSKAYELDLAARLGKPIVLLPASLGPFKQPRNQRLIRQLVKRAALVLLRDERSLRHLQEIGADTRRTRVVPDVVFALVSDEGLERLAQAELRDRPSIAVSVRDIRPFAEGDAQQEQDDYETAVAGLVVRLVRQTGATVLFTSTCQGVPEYWTDDSHVADSVVARLPADVLASVRVSHAAHDVDGMRQSFADVDLAVCTRMHAAILALGVGTPVLPISYEFKIDEVMGQLGLGDVVVPVAGISAGSLEAAWERLVGTDFTERFSGVADELEAARRRLGSVHEELSAALR